ncbi:NSF attachment protein [Loa loa]|uniref:Gamma-soluble NSF attachment protein n=1 Tax=Loa loa TaxID=7209 RepID=A0A1I7V7Q7_LOALO|nr:NSF attachment protein [Loa loa]EFO25390.1 NSF attachment protein [Loa loa]
MDEMSRRRVAEATECIRKAETHLKTSILKMKFKPDYDSAAMEYDRAAVCFRNASQMKQSRDAYLKAAEMHKENGNLFHWAKCNESAATICKEMGDSCGTLKYMDLAANGYAESGSNDSSAMALDKAGKCLEDIDPEKAIEVYHKALTMVQETDRSRIADGFMARLTKLYLKLKRYREAADMINEEIEKYTEVKEAGRVGQLTIALVLVQLACDDAVSATKSIQKSFKCEDFEISEDAKVCCALISAFESGDNSRFQQVLQRPVLRSMDNEYLRLMKELKASSEVSGVNEDNSAYEGGDDCEDLK